MLCFVLGATQLTQAQIDFGIKAGLNFNSDGFKPSEALSKDNNYGTESKLGYHAGIWTRFKLPVVGLYIRPELVYTALKSEVSKTIKISKKEEKEDYNFQKIDLPVLLGYKFAKVVNVFAGPSFQYIIGNNISFDDVKEIDGKSFTVGMQLGAGVEFGSLGVDVRWERGFSDTETKIINSAGKEAGKFDTRVNQIILGLSYKF